MKPILSSLLFAAALFSATAVYAVGEATPDEAKAMAIKAADYLKVVWAGQGVCRVRCQGRAVARSRSVRLRFR